MSATVYGIDLGTTYSAIARVNNAGGAEVIQNFEGDTTTPSVVNFEAPERAIIGAEAKRVAISDPDNTCLLIKRHMGTDFPQNFHGETYSPEAISALILKELVGAANSQLGIDAVKVVITVPAYFGAKEREATLQAGRIAGLEVIGIVTEPVAAALSIGAGNNTAETIMVYDLGGGTFDTTILNISAGRVEVIAIDGSRKLGGADWDEVFIELIVRRFLDAAGSTIDDPRHDEEFMLELRLEVEGLKRTLTIRESATVRLAFEGNRANIDVSRAEFELVTQHLIEQTVDISERTVESARRKDPSLTVDRILLVGGSSRMPMVAAALKDRLGWDAQITDFDLAVAKGAAIYGQAAVEEILRHDDNGAPTDPAVDAPGRPYFPGASSTLTVHNVLSRAVGVAVVRDRNTSEKYVHFLVSANEKIPCTAVPLMAGTSVDGQTSILVEMYEQGGERESETLEDNVLLKNAELQLPPGLPAGAPIEVRVDVSAEGLISMIATDVTNERSVALEARVSVLDESQVGLETEKVAALALSS